MPGALGALWRFARPHTVIGTTLCVVGLYAIAIAGRVGHGGVLPLPGWAEWTGYLWGSGLAAWGQLALLGTVWLSSLGANVFVVGLNQLYDVPIDRINKPYLPLASGALTRGQAWAVVLTAAGGALGLAVLVGPVLLATIGLCMAIGAAYSLPPLRFKRFAGLAALCIVAVRGVIVNPGIYLSFALILDRGPAVPGGHPAAVPATVPEAIWALTLFMIGMSLAIAIAKDMPDVEGDRHFAVNTLAVRFGPQPVFALSRGLLAACYLGMIGAGLIGLDGVSSVVLITTHAVLLAILLRAARRVPPGDVAALASFYRLMWRLFYAEYVVFPLACVL
jgi:homogentisate phytyltransferase/homogentisate geranylgeranyltransferase